jgi:hypothetical protein
LDWLGNVSEAEKKSNVMIEDGAELCSQQAARLEAADILE